MTLNSFSNPSLTSILGKLSVATAGQPNDTSISFDNGLITSDGDGDLTVQSIMPVGVSGGLVNVRGQGATGNGTTDDTAAIQASINLVSSLGGIVWLPPGTYLISAPLLMAHKNCVLAGCGPASTLLPSPSFVGAELLLITADFCGVRDLQIAYANHTSSSNPSATGIEISGARFGLLSNLQLNYINGWAIEAQSTASINIAGWHILDIHINHCAMGMHVLGTAATNNVVQWFISNFHPEAIDNGDALLLEECFDVTTVNVDGAVAGGSVVGSTIHIKGGAALFFLNVDVGQLALSSVSNTIEIEAGITTPDNIRFLSGVAQQGLAGIQIDAGTQILIFGMELAANASFGCNVNGAASSILVDACSFSANGQAGSANRFDIRSNSSGHVKVTNCYFRTAIGPGNPQVNAAVRYLAGHMEVFGNYMEGSGSSNSNAIQGNLTICRDNTVWNPQNGNVGTPAIGASPWTSTAIGTDSYFYISGGTVSAIAVDGVTTNQTSGTFFVPATGTITITYTVAPTNFVRIGN